MAMYSGSFIGWIVRPTATDGGDMHLIPVVDDQGEFLQIKIEAIALLPQVESRVRMLALTDNDGGQSEMFDSWSFATEKLIFQIPL
jgi:hypothetical protein